MVVDAQRREPLVRSARASKAGVTEVRAAMVHDERAELTLLTATAG